MPNIASYNAIDVGNIASINGQDIASGGAYNPVTDSGTYTETVPTSGMLKFGGMRISGTGSDSSNMTPRHSYGANPVVNISTDKDGQYVRVAVSKSDFVKFSDGRYSAFAITASGQLWEIGSSLTYMQGSASDTWQQVTGVGDSDTGWTVASSSYDGGLAINSGKLYHIGGNSYGQAGTGSTSTQYGSWAQVGSDSDWQDVKRGRYYSMATKTSSNVLYVAGRNSKYATGLDTDSGNTTSWTAINSDNFTNTNVTFFTVNSDGGFLITGGEVYAWGDEDSNERFGLNSSSDLTKPTQTGNVGGSLQSDWVQGCLTNSSMSLINTSGKLYHTGEATARRGDGSTTDNKDGNFVQIGSDTNWVRVEADPTGQTSSDYGMSAQKGNRLFFWGYNQYSGVIDGALSSTFTATEIYAQDLASGNYWQPYLNYGSNTKYGIVGIYAATADKLLDTYTGAAAAFSVRLLDKDYSGNCMRIRRDSDDSETDIGFDGSGDLDTSAIATHCGSANGYVVTWYDQANVGGTANNATQSTGGDQPQIYNGSAVITTNGKPALNFDGSNDVLKATGGTWSQLAFAGVMYIDVPADSVALQYGTTDARFHVGVGNRSSASKIGSRVYDGAFFGDDGADITDGQYLVYNDASIGPDTNDMYLNGAAVSQAYGTRSGTPSLATYTIGCRGNGAYFFLGKFQELIVWESDQSSNRSGIENDINTYFSIY